jgi:hypothetical protein
VPREHSGEAKRERDRQFHDAAKLCSTIAHIGDARVGAVRHLRRDDSLGVDDLDRQYRRGQQEAADQSDERGLQIVSTHSTVFTASFPCGEPWSRAVPDASRVAPGKRRHEVVGPIACGPSPRCPT